MVVSLVRADFFADTGGYSAIIYHVFSDSKINLPCDNRATMDLRLCAYS